MEKQAWTWKSQNLPEPARMARWGHFGTPVLIFPTAGGDFEEVERFQLIAALGTLIDGGRIKAYSIDGIAIREWLAATLPPQDYARLQERYDSYAYEEVLQRVRQDCRDDRIEPILIGASRGASVAIGGICRHPESFRGAVGLSGVYGLAATGSSPLSSLSALDASRLERLRLRTIALGSGAGDYENPDDSKRLSDAFASKNLPCTLSLWGPTRDHTWATWREMLPALLTDQL